jgi:hypothetical protein
MRLALALLLTATAAQAETPMTAAEFEAWSTGKTLDYYIDGTFWGSEQHLAGRTTLDADADGPCNHGEWFPRGDDICFSYEVSPGPHCWRFLRDGNQVLAEILDEPDGQRFVVQTSDAPLACPGPDVGV